MKRFLPALLAAFFPLSLSQAGREENLEPAPLPAGPLLKRAPDFSAWAVTYTYPKLKDDDASHLSAQVIRLQKLAVTKTKAIYHEAITFTDGSSRESWRVGALQVSPTPGSGKLAIYDPSSFPSTSSGQLISNPSVYTDYSCTDFPGLEWVSPHTYVGLLRTEDSAFLVFRDSSTSTTAYIDLQTRLPNHLESPERSAVYSFGTPPLVMQQLPQEIGNLLEKRAKAIKILSTTSPSF